MIPTGTVLAATAAAAPQVVRESAAVAVMTAAAADLAHNPTPTAEPAASGLEERAVIAPQGLPSEGGSLDNDVAMTEVTTVTAPTETALTGFSTDSHPASGTADTTTAARVSVQVHPNLGRNLGSIWHVPGFIAAREVRSNLVNLKWIFWCCPTFDFVC